MVNKTVQRPSLKSDPDPLSWIANWRASTHLVQEGFSLAHYHRWMIYYHVRHDDREVMTERPLSSLIKINAVIDTLYFILYQWLNLTSELVLHTLSINFSLIIYLKDNAYLIVWFSPLSLIIRRWFLDMIVEVNDARILKFLETRFQAADLSATEALEALLLSMNHLQAIPDLVEMAKVS